MQVQVSQERLANHRAVVPDHCGDAAEHLFHLLWSNTSHPRFFNILPLLLLVSFSLCSPHQHGVAVTLLNTVAIITYGTSKHELENQTRAVSLSRRFRDLIHPWGWNTKIRATLEPHRSWGERLQCLDQWSAASCNAQEWRATYTTKDENDTSGGQEGQKGLLTPGSRRVQNVRLAPCQLVRFPAATTFGTQWSVTLQPCDHPLIQSPAASGRHPWYQRFPWHSSQYIEHQKL